MNQPFTVYVNDQPVGNSQKYNQYDVTRLLKKGTNNLRVTWTDTNGVGGVELAHAADGRTFRTLTEVKFEGFRANPRDKTVEFTIP
ncbi:hypothetical protein V3W47_03930 [Deinococcus sp. YIM 134068]|uniref:hypothetical protein n=1 Tax=Deinococcus lichenicola TaxID=3118910 RepID=UPI002F93E365